jgi:hypothetical protein
MNAEEAMTRDHHLRAGDYGRIWGEDSPGAEHGDMDNVAFFQRAGGMC